MTAAYQANATAATYVGPTVVVGYATAATTGTATWDADVEASVTVYSSNIPQPIEPPLAVLPRRRSKRAQRARMAPPAAPLVTTGRPVAICVRPIGRRWGREARHPLTRSPFQGDRCVPGPSATT